MAHGSQGLFTQVGFNDPSQDDNSQGHFGVGNANPLQSQVSVVLRNVKVYIDFHRTCLLLSYSTSELE